MSTKPPAKPRGAKYAATPNVATARQRATTTSALVARPTILSATPETTVVIDGPQCVVEEKDRTCRDKSVCPGSVPYRTTSGIASFGHPTSSTVADPSSPAGAGTCLATWRPQFR